VVSLAAALLCLCAPACARADWPLSARALTASAAPHALPLRLRLRPRAQPRCETAVGARGAAALSIGVQGLLPRAPWWWKRHRERAFGALWQTLPPEAPNQRCCARADEPCLVFGGRLSVVVYLSGTLSRYERNLPAVLNASSNPQVWGPPSFLTHTGSVFGRPSAVFGLSSALRLCALS
jgi:hypothetical protein